MCDSGEYLVCVMLVSCVYQDCIRSVSGVYQDIKIILK